MHPQVYESVRAMGQAEHASLSGSMPGVGPAAPSKSRAMLENLLATASLGMPPGRGGGPRASAAGGGGARGGRPQSASGRMTADTAGTAVSPKFRPGSPVGSLGTVVRLAASTQV